MKRRKTVEYFFSNTDPEILNVILANANAKNIINGKSLNEVTEWPFCDIAEIGNMDAYTAVMWILNKYLNMDERSVLKSSAVEFVSMMKHIENEMVKISEFMNMLQSEPDADMINSGIESLDKFGVINIYYSINKNPTTWDSISEVSFNKMFTKLLLDKEHGDIQKRYDQIQKNKQLTK